MLDKLKAKLSEKANSFMNEIRVPDEVREERFQICLSCEHLVHKINMCSKCGCLMNAKTWLANQSCPVKKWVIYPTEQ